jgi:phospholipid/cholesterol/gamma-HCH transport system substrate-binding protein
MLRRHLVETIMGTFVLLVAGIFLAFAYVSANMKPTEGYPLTASFNAVDGLAVGDDVRVAGIKVGSVAATSLDAKNFRAVVRFDLHKEIQLPVDSKASILSGGILGGKYVNIEPGHDAALLKGGDEFKNTEGAVLLEDQIGAAIFNPAKSE